MIDTIQQLITTNTAVINQAMTSNASADEWQRIGENIEEQLRIVRKLKTEQ